MGHTAIMNLFHMFRAIVETCISDPESTRSPLSWPIGYMQDRTHSNAHSDGIIESTSDNGQMERYRNIVRFMETGAV